MKGLGLFESGDATLEEKCKILLMYFLLYSVHNLGSFDYIDWFCNYKFNYPPFRF